MAFDPWSGHVPGSRVDATRIRPSSRRSRYTCPSRPSMPGRNRMICVDRPSGGGRVLAEDPDRPLVPCEEYAARAGVERRPGRGGVGVVQEVLIKAEIVVLAGSAKVSREPARPIVARASARLEPAAARTTAQKLFMTWLPISATATFSNPSRVAFHRINFPAAGIGSSIPVTEELGGRRTERPIFSSRSWTIIVSLSPIPSMLRSSRESPLRKSTSWVRKMNRRIVNT